MTDNNLYSQYYKEKMNNQFNNHLPHIPPKQNYKSLNQETIARSNSNKKSKANLAILIILTILLTLSFASLLIFLEKNQINLIIIASLGIILLFLILSFLHRVYEISLLKTHPAMLMIIIYTLLLINMILGTKIYSIEWAFLGFIISSIIIYDSEIDSRFMLLPALLLLGYLPFLLIGNFNEIAETTAIYVYYFLVCGVVLQITENIRKTINIVNFETFSIGVLKEFDWINISIFTGIISISVFIISRFYEISLVKWTSVYFFILSIFIYFLGSLKQKEIVILK
jgi:hypothetical protein